MTAASGVLVLNRAMRSYHRGRRKRAVLQLLVGLGSLGFAAVSLRGGSRSGVDQSDVVNTTPNFEAAAAGEDREGDEEGETIDAEGVDESDVVTPETDLEGVSDGREGDEEGGDIDADDVDESDVVTPGTDLEDVSDGREGDEGTPNGDSVRDDEDTAGSDDPETDDETRENPYSPEDFADGDESA